ncbi:MAG: Gfo/Idh/MocA family oxidoreductase [Albidovulum sp.]|nr:Gfo/Idh/MocA family oxidoreductase [Albidovulum sp.]
MTQKISSDRIRIEFGRKLRLGFVGGGRDSVIGGTHLAASRVDGFYELTAGVFSVDHAVSRATADAEFVASDRVYSDFNDMARVESERDDGIDVVTIAAPPNLHFPIAKSFLECGIDVICEKPMTRSLSEAEELDRLVLANDRLFCLTHCYTGYPMVRHAREMIRNGELGTIRIAEGELAAGDPGVSFEPEDPDDRHWRFRRDTMGEGAILGEVSSHAHHLLTYVVGDDASEVSAELNTFVERREVFDNSYVMLRFENGARGRVWGSYVAAGNDHGLWFRIFGDKGNLTWVQEDPEVLWFKPIGKAAIRIAKGYGQLSGAADRASRLRPGHPEGYILAFGNLYSDFACAVAARKLGKPYHHFLDLLPNTLDGLRTMAHIEAAVESNSRNGEWVHVAPIRKAQRRDAEE